jgi:hypothetical protein
MPRRTHRGWPEHYPIIHPWSEVRYRPTCRHTKLLSLGILYVSYASVQFKCLFIRAQPTRVLIDTGGGYHLEVPNIRSDHPFLFIQYFLFFSNCPTQSSIMLFYQLISHDTLQDKIHSECMESHNSRTHRVKQGVTLLPIATLPVICTKCKL